MLGVESFVVSGLQDIFIRSDLQKPTNYIYAFYTHLSYINCAHPRPELR
ncbi:MAG: hypothetical protein ACJAS1_002858 [Oleiphilaceae bacterium]|jgi:hypothetical protein